MIGLALVLAAIQPAGAPAEAPAFVPCNRRPVPRAPCVNLAVLFGNAAYPSDSWARGEQGDVSFRVEVDSYGNVTRCWITRSSGYRSLDARTCVYLRRFVVYNAARDANGRAIGGTDEGTVHWRHPRPRPAAGEAR
ncbi:MAG TPA: TonB family protein [Allosphingosinicella sp.]|nr:TonB family protein [Allosphingosinicella sp.]